MLQNCPIPTVSENHIERFFWFARERYNMYLKRERGEPWPWTEDPVLSNNRFTNTFRELDKTTVWFRENIRGPLAKKPCVILATLAFRFFNRIEVGEILKPYLLEDNWCLGEWEAKLKAHQEAGNPLVTGAYIVKTRAAMTKLDSILMSLHHAKLHEPAILEWLRLNKPKKRRARELWELLCTFDYQGQFTANEIIVDLYHTDVLRHALDLNSWTNPGPGAAQGIGLLLHNNGESYNRTSQKDREAMLEIMKCFLAASKQEEYWPKEYPPFERLHDVQFLMCEISKWIKGHQGRRLKRRFVPNVGD